MPDVTVTPLHDDTIWRVTFSNGKGNVLDGELMRRLTDVFRRAQDAPQFLAPRFLRRCRFRERRRGTPRADRVATCRTQYADGEHQQNSDQEWFFAGRGQLNHGDITLSRDRVDGPCL